MKGVSETTKNEAKKQKGGFIRILLGTLDDNLLGNLWIGKGTIKACGSTVSAGQDFSCRFIL